MNVRSVVIELLPSSLKIYAKETEASPIGYRLARGAFWSIAGAIISRGLGMLSSIIIARTLGKVGFGELGIINSTAIMFQLFAGFGIGLTSTKYIAEYRQSDCLKAGRIIGMAWIITALTGGICAIILALFSPWLANHILAAPHLSGLLRITSITLFISALNAAQEGALSGLEAFKTIATRNLIAGIINFPIVVTGVLLAGLKGAVWANVISYGFNWLMCHIALKKEVARFNIPLTFSGSLQELPLIWKFSLPAVLSGLMVTPVNWVCNTMLVNQPNGYAEMGIFNAANQWFGLILFLPTNISKFVLPVLSERLSIKEFAVSRKILKLSIIINGMIVAPIVIISCFFSRIIMSFYGQNFSSGWMTLIIVLLTAELLAIQLPIGDVIAASGRMWLGFIMNMGWGLAFIGFNYILIKEGSFGLAFSRFGAYTLHATWTFIFAHYFLKHVKRSVVLDET